MKPPQGNLCTVRLGTVVFDTSTWLTISILLQKKISDVALLIFDGNKRKPVKGIYEYELLKYYI